MNKNIIYEINNKNLNLINDGNKYVVAFDFPIRQVISFDEYFIVRIEPDVGVIYNENVFGVSLKGKVLWQIKAIPHVYDDSPYTGIGKDGENAKLSNWDGTDLLVKPMTGEIIKKSFSK
jgi:hypothetical protein